MQITQKLCLSFAAVSFLASIMLAGCDQTAADSSRENEPPKPSHQVTGVGYPLSWLAGRLVDDSIDVLTVTPSPDKVESWRPSRDQILSMQRSDIIFVNGSAAPFASWLPHVTLPDPKICQTANDGLKLADMIAVKDIRIVHSHGPEGEHSHPTMTAYTWLDPAMAAKQAAVMAKRLKSIYPNLKSSIDVTESKLTKELEQLSSRLSEIKTQVTEPLNVLTSSPDLKFLTRAAGLSDVHLNWRKPPTSDEAKAQLEAKISLLETRPEFMLLTSEPSPELRSAVESLNLEIVVLNPMTYAPVKGDYLAVMRDNAQRLRTVLTGSQNQAQSQTDESEPN